MKKKVAIGCGTVFVLFMAFGILYTFVPGLFPKSSTTTSTVTEVELNKAKEQGLVDYYAIGTGSIESLELNITSKTTKPLNIRVTRGSIFNPFESFVQRMIVISDALISLDPKETIKEYEIKVACINMKLSAPGRGNQMTIANKAPNDDLIKLVQLPAFQGKGFRFQQFAIWTITDNPINVDEYQGIASGGYPFGSGPTNEDIEAIRMLFENAGIDTSKYYALK